MGYCTNALSLSSESVQSSSLSLQCVDDIQSGHSLPARVLGVRDSVADDVLQEYLEYSTGLLVDESGDTLDTTSTSETTDGGLGDSLDVISEDLPVSLGSSLSESLSSFTAARHLLNEHWKGSSALKTVARAQRRNRNAATMAKSIFSGRGSA